jgi:hypothetical protein
VLDQSLVVLFCDQNNDLLPCQNERNGESAPKLGCTHAQVRVIPFLWLGLVGGMRGDDRPTNANGDRAREARGRREEEG